MRSNILVPLKRIPNSNTDGPVEMMRSRLERHTKYWPMIISSTLMFNLKQVCTKKVVNQVLRVDTIVARVSNNGDQNDRLKPILTRARVHSNVWEYLGNF